MPFYTLNYKNRVSTTKKPGFEGQNFVGSYGFSCRRKNGDNHYLWSLLKAIVGSRAKGSMRLMRQLRSSLSPERFSMVLKKATRKVGTIGEIIKVKTYI